MPLVTDGGVEPRRLLARRLSLPRRSSSTLRQARRRCVRLVGVRRGPSWPRQPPFIVGRLPERLGECARCLSFGFVAVVEDGWVVVGRGVEYESRRLLEA